MHEHIENTKTYQTEIMELKNTTILKNFLERFSSTLYQAEEKTADIKDRSLEIILSFIGAKPKWNKKEWRKLNGLMEPNQEDQYVYMEVPEGEEREN